MDRFACDWHRLSTTDTQKLHTYYKRRTEELTNDWEKISCAIRNEFRDLGVIDAENKYLDGIGAQYDSEVIYHNMIKELEDKNVIFLDTDTALKKHPNIFKKYFNNLVKYDDYITMLKDLYSGDIDAAFVSGGYVEKYSSISNFEHIKEEVKVVVVKKDS